MDKILLIISWIAKGAAAGKEALSLFKAATAALESGSITEEALDAKLEQIAVRHDRIQGVDIQ